MWKGESTNHTYEKCLSSGFCSKHIKEFGMDGGPEESVELQGKTILYMRLCLLNPFLFGKPYTSKTMRDLATKCNAFPEEGFIDRRKFKPGGRESVILFDSVATYTLCYLSRICCAAGLFMEARQDGSEKNDPSSFIQKIITAKRLTAEEINSFVRFLKKNFEGFDGEFVKEANLMALLFVRELRSLKLATALKQLEKDLSVNPAIENWKQIGNKEYNNERYEESVSAYSTALDLNPYNHVIFSNRAQAFIKMNRYEEAELDSRAAIMICPSWYKGFCKLVLSLLQQSYIQDACNIAHYGIQNCKESPPAELEMLKNLLKEAQDKWLEHKLINRKIHNDKDVSIDEDNVIFGNADIPDLTDSSSGSDSDVEAKVVKVKTKSKPIQEFTTKIKLDEESHEIKQKKVISTLKEASSAMSEGCGHLAMKLYLSVLNKVKISPEVYKFEECDLVHLKYVYGAACCKSGTLEDLLKSINIFKEIIDEHSDVKFPAAYYGMGLAYCKLNRFKEALTFLTKVHSFVEKGIHCKVFNWPGTLSVIEETKSDKLKLLIEDLMNKCMNPPVPNAICRYSNCSFQPPIYYTDPDFKGFFTILCSEQCMLRYHPACWKAVRSMKNLSDKEYLDQSCLTPDCLGTVIKVECTGKDGNIEKIFSSEECDKGKKMKQKKTKVEKKHEVKEKRRRKRQSSLTLSESKSDTAETVADSIVDESVICSTLEIEHFMPPIEVLNECQVGESSSARLSVNAESFTVLRKDDCENEESIQKASKQKERKKSKKNKLSIDEFCGKDFSYYNEYQTRLNKLQENRQFVEGGQEYWSNFCENERIPDLDPSRPFHIPEGLRNDPYTLETILQSVDQTSENETAKNIKETIYTFLEDILSYKGPLNINDPELTQELETFPIEARQVINENGGFKNFMLKSMRFAIVKDYVCVIDDVVKAYDLSSKSQIELLSNTVDELDKFETECNTGPKKFPNSISDNFSHLNPDAIEYKPINYQLSSSLGYSEANKTNKYPKINSVNSENRDSKSLLCVVNELRQPINREMTKINKTFERNFNSSGLHEDFKPFTNYNHDGPNDLRSFTKATPNCKLSSISMQEMSDTMLTNNLYQIIKLLYSDKFSQEQRLQINDYLKPYAIIKVSPKQNKCVQGMPQVEMVSQGVMKDDDELNNTMKLLDTIKIENDALIQEKLQLEDKLTSSLDSTTKLQKKITVENCSLKKQLEDVKHEFQVQQEELISKQTQSENEQKRLQQLLNKSLEDSKASKKEICDIKKENKRLELQVKDLEDKITLMEVEKESLSKFNDTLKSKSDGNVESMKKELFKMGERAKNAELEVLKIKKDEFLKRIDEKVIESRKRIKDIHDGIKSLGHNLEPHYTACIQTLLLKINDYINNLTALRTQFLINIDEQIKEIKAGASLSKLKPIKIENLPEVPSFSTDSLRTLNMRVPSYQSSVGSANLILNNGASSIQNQMLNASSILLPHNNAKNCILPNSNLDLSTSGLNVPFAPVAANFLPCNVKPVLNKPYINCPPATNIASTTLKGAPGIQMHVPLPTLATPTHPHLQPAANSASTPFTPELTCKLSITTPPSSVTNEDQNKTSVSADHQINTLQKSSSASFDGASTSLSSSKSSLTETSIMSSAGSSTVTPISLEYSVSENKSQKMEDKKISKSSSVHSLTSQKHDTKNSYTKLLSKLLLKYPNFSQSQLMEYITELRKQQKGNKLSGLSMDAIVSKVGEIIERQYGSDVSTQNKTKLRPTVLINKNIASLQVETKPQVDRPSSQECPWAKSQQNHTSQWTGDSEDKSCIICYEDMTAKTAYRVDCGHKFHYTCIKEWLNKTSNCPICRVHLLLPDDYPSLT